ncbi:hypothetical protein [Provencibacterium massiliense]|uniref:hypothetical protein n=1 Tax=Provencibacterium massiliense TaxID=1841868 RepID=UPI00117B925B|nr:hypothetical protein [Provencibacterium massiliense]
MKYFRIWFVVAGLLLSLCGCSQSESPSQTVSGNMLVDSGSSSASVESAAQSTALEEQNEKDLSSSDASSVDEPLESSSFSESSIPPDNIQSDQSEPEISSTTDERLNEINSIYLHQVFFLDERECTLTDQEDFQLVLSLADDLTLSDVYGPITGAGGVEITIFYQDGQEENYLFYSNIVKDDQQPDPDEWYICGNPQAFEMLQNFFEE